MWHRNNIGKPSQIISYGICLFGMLASIFSACVSQIELSTPLPTVTLIQTIQIETNTPYPTTTPRPTVTDFSVSTPDKLANLASEFDIPTVCLFTNTYLISRDQNWLGTDCKLNREMMVINKLSGDRFIAPYYKIEEDAPENFSIHPLSWSRDDLYLYFTTRCCSYDDMYNDNGPLYRYNTQNKAVDIVLRGSSQSLYFFSKDGERYVYINQYPEFTLEFGMAEIFTQKNKRVVLQGYMITNDIFQWSKDENKFAIIIDRLISRSEHTSDWKEVLLRMDFTKMEMELVDEFTRNNLFDEN